ncbi:hypothetical protein ACQPUY_06235 [Clostridium nigeriense]
MTFKEILNKNNNNEIKIEDKNAEIAVKLPEWSLVPKTTNIIRIKRNA